MDSRAVETEMKDLWVCQCDFDMSGEAMTVIKGDSRGRSGGLVFPSL